MTTMAKTRMPIAAWGFASDAGVAEPTRMICPALHGNQYRIQNKGGLVVQTDNRKDNDSGIATPHRIRDNTANKGCNVDPETIEL